MATTDPKSQSPATAPGEQETTSKKKSKKVQREVSRQEVAKACRAAKGIEYGTEASHGRPYGCVTDKSWIDCDSPGNCEGGTQEGEDETKAKLETAIRGWTKVRRLEVTAAAAGTSPCRSCDKTRAEIQGLDRVNAALVRESQTLLRRANQGKVSTKNEATRIHRRLQEITRQLTASTRQRQTLLEQHEAQLLEATAAARADKTRGTNKAPGPSAPPAQAGAPVPRGPTQVQPAPRTRKPGVAADEPGPIGHEQDPIPVDPQARAVAKQKKKDGLKFVETCYLTPGRCDTLKDCKDCCDDAAEACKDQCRTGIFSCRAACDEAGDECWYFVCNLEWDPDHWAVHAFTEKGKRELPTRMRLGMAVDAWAEVSKVEPTRQPGAGTGPRRTSERALAEIERIDRQTAALVRESETLLRRIDQRSVRTAKELRRTHQRLQQITRQLEARTEQRKLLLARYEAEGAQAQPTRTAKPEQPSTTRQPRQVQPAGPPPAVAAPRRQVVEGAVIRGNEAIAEEGYRFQKVSATKARLMDKRGRRIGGEWDCSCSDDDGGVGCKVVTTGDTLKCKADLCKKCTLTTIIVGAKAIRPPGGGVAAHEPDPIGHEQDPIPVAPPPGKLEEPGSSQPGGLRSRPYTGPGAGEQEVEKTWTVRTLASKLSVECTDKKGKKHKYTISTTEEGGCATSYLTRGGKSTTVGGFCLDKKGNKTRVNCSKNEGEGGCDYAYGKAECKKE